METKEILSEPPYPCRVCELTNVTEHFTTCTVCGWIADTFQDANSDTWNGTNKLSLNEYKEVWKSNTAKIKSYDLDKSELVNKLFKKQHSKVVTARENYSKRNKELIDKIGLRAIMKPSQCKCCDNKTLNMIEDCKTCGWKNNLVQNADPRSSKFNLAAL